MEIRRIVTGNDAEGRSVFVSDGPAPPPEAFAAMAARAEAVAPVFGGTTVWLGVPCAYWPVPATG